LGADFNTSKQFYDELVASWKDLMSRIELSNYFGSSFRPVEAELKTKSGQERFIKLHTSIFASLLTALNSQEVKKTLSWKIDTCTILENLAHLKKNVCVIGMTSITLVLADN
jgi:hypothetical protein